MSCALTLVIPFVPRYEWVWWTRICEDAAQLIEDDLVFSLGGDGRSRELAGVSGVLWKMP